MLGEGKTQLEVDLETLFGYSPDPSSGSGLGSGGDESSSGDSSGSSSGGGGSTSGPSGGGSVVLAGTFGFFKGLGQGVCNLVNGVQDAAVGVANLAKAIPNTVAGGIDYATGATDPNYQIRVPYISSPDWSRNLVTEEGGTPGGWDDSHGWSKFFAGEGTMSLLTGGASKAASAVDDAGLCANRASATWSPGSHEESKAVGHKLGDTHNFRGVVEILAWICFNWVIGLFRYSALGIS